MNVGDRVLVIQGGYTGMVGTIEAVKYSASTEQRKYCVNLVGVASESIYFDPADIAHISEQNEEEEQGKKFDDGKIKMGMVFSYFAKPLSLIAKCGTYGWRKYAREDEYWDKNWHRLTNGPERYTDAVLRHLMAHLRGEIVDKESGLPHLAHAAWGLCAVIALDERIKE
jgi:hypothetical protein